jgi:DivIVA domain-containing protein
MIDLTPLEVRKKKGDFRRTFRGYDPELVDDFLDMAADRLDEIVRENIAITERVGRLEERVADYREREKALTEALVSAQEFRQERLNQASREADLRVAEATADAERIRAGALRDREREEEALRRVRARRAQLVESFRAFLQRELHQLDVETAALELSDAAVEAAARVWALGDESATEDDDGAADPAAGPAAPAERRRAVTRAEDARAREVADDAGPPITGNEAWLPLLDDER